MSERAPQQLTKPAAAGGDLRLAALAGLVVRTPCVPLAQPNGSTVWAKLEYLQPSGSTKDRFAAAVLGDALATGALRPGGPVVEASSGSTSIALAMACARIGVRFVAVVPDSVSDERLMMIRRYGGEVVLTAACDGMAGAVQAAEAVAARLGSPGAAAFMPRQFSNPVNALAHERGTAAELLEQVDGPVDAFVAGVGTGGTLAGVGRALRRRCPGALLAEARPACAGPACGGAPVGIPGIVACMSGLLDQAAVGRVVPVSEAEAVAAARDLCARGLPVGLSSGLNMAAACLLAAELGPGSRVATVFPDRMERYFSGALFADFRS